MGFSSLDPASFVHVCMDVLTSWGVMTCTSKQEEQSHLAHSLHHGPLIWIITAVLISTGACLRLSYRAGVGVSPEGFRWSEWALYYSCQTLDQLDERHRQEGSRGRRMLPCEGIFIHPRVSAMAAIIAELMKRGELGEGLDLDINSCKSAGKCFVFHRGEPLTAALCSCTVQQTFKRPLLYCWTLNGVKHQEERGK